MKPLKSQIVILSALYLLLHFSVNAQQPVTSKESRAIQEKLSAFERGEIGIKELTLDGGSTLRKEIINYFKQTYTNGFPAKQKIVVCRALAIEGDYKGASFVALEYLKSFPNDSLGYRILGGASVMLGEKQRALYAYTNAVVLGDEECYVPLVVQALELGRLEIIRDIVPHLLILKRVERTPKSTRLEIVGLLAVYSARTQDKIVFQKALLGVEADELILRQDIADMVVKTCKQFSLESTIELCKRLSESADLKAAKSNAPPVEAPAKSGKPAETPK